MNECCKTSPKTEHRPKPDVVVSTCTVCGRKHIEMVADPIRLGVKVL